VGPGTEPGNIGALPYPIKVRRQAILRAAGPLPSVPNADTFGRMSDARPRFFFDFVDPGSYLMELRLERASAGRDQTVERVPFELRPPPEPVVDAQEPGWVAYWQAMAEALAHEGVEVARPALIPWTRKAHELLLHVGEVVPAQVATVRRTLFGRFHEQGEDIGRIDVLLSAATEAGLDLTATKAVLDVDRHADTVMRVREQALAEGVRGVPTLLSGDHMLEGVLDDEAIEHATR
jgi:predicted DsbA family dithiol-disulfide isomerase